MLRRDFLTIAMLSLFPKREYGWIPCYAQPDYKTKHLRSFGQNKVALLWKPWEKVTGKEWEPHRQKYADCIAQATGAGMDILSTVQIAQGKAEKWITKSSCDAIYSGGRNNIPHEFARNGMRGWWATKYLQTYGNLLRQKYDSIDLTPYSRQTCIELNRNPLPQFLLDYAKLHPLLDYSSLNSYSEIRDAVASGHPVLFCSTMGAENSQRDKDGFIKPKGKWPHGWLIAGVDDGRRPGVCLLNSYGKWASGPKRHNQPDGSVWIDARYIDYHVKRNEAYALSNYKGFPIPERKYILW